MDFGLDGSIDLKTAKRITIVALALMIMLALVTASVSAETAAGEAGEKTATEEASESTSKPGWQKDAGGWKYFDQDGNPIADKWSKIGDRWYHFSKSGYMQHGWLKDNDRWYYLGWPDDTESGAMRHGWIRLDDRWYYLGWPDDAESGAMRHGWVKLDDKWYYFGTPDDSESGAMRHGWFKDNEKWYYMGWPDDSESGAMRRGWLELKDTWYYLGHPDNSDSGAMVTGVANTKKADEDAKYYYFNESGAWKEVCRSIRQDGTDWMVIKGVANKVITESDKTLYRALGVLASITTDEMTDDEKLQAAFNYVKRVPEFNTRVPHYKGMDWPIVYANDVFVGTGAGRTGTKGGNCFSINAAFGYLARAIGYEEVYACHDTGHGFVEIDGLVYDPEWSKTHHQYTFYGIPFDTPVELQNYKLALTASHNNPYMRIKLKIN